MEITPRTLSRHEKAVQIIEQHICSDTCTITLNEKIGGLQSTPTMSGAGDFDYPSLRVLSRGLINVNQITSVSKTPLPSEVMEHFGHMRTNCMMGTFVELGRAWLTVDSDFYIWSYDRSCDVTYYDGLTETIISVGIVTPREGVFNKCIKYLIVLTTSVEIVFIGISFSGADVKLCDLNFIQEPIFAIASDGIIFNIITSMQNGRIFLGGKDGNLYEITYQQEGSWFGKTCRKINHSSSTLTCLLPSILTAFSENSPIINIYIDEIRNFLYCLRENSSIELFDLGDDGKSTRKVISISQSSVVRFAKTILPAMDDSLYYPIVSIMPMEPVECNVVHMIAVAQSGVRLYFTTGSDRERPYTLQLVHIRLPPGFSPNSLYHRPTGVHTSAYKKGTTLMISSNQGTENDTLWCLSGDLFPFRNQLVESCTQLALEGPTWAVSEIIGSESNMTSFTDPLMSSTPTVVTQHNQNPRKWLVLSPQGCNVISLLRPVDILRKLLMDYQGPANEAVRAYFQSQPEPQACATSLILACSIQTPVEISQWATQAFFMYGGSPGLLKMSDPNVTAIQQSQMYGAQNFSPNIASTPMTGRASNSFVQSNMSPSYSPYRNTSFTSMGDEKPFFQFSAKHIGLNLYFSRILRPIWNMLCVEHIHSDAGKHLMISRINKDDCEYLLNQLYALRAFLDTHMVVNVSNSLLNAAYSSPVPQNIRGTSAYLIDPHQEEKASLDNLKAFLGHTCEIIGLWKILCEHQFPVIAKTIPDEMQSQLREFTFRTLFVAGTKICVALIVGLINTYLLDNATLDNVSEKLRQVCPTLFRHEDAACSKANEILLKIRNNSNLHPEDRSDMIQVALQLCKNAAPNLPLDVVCQQFASIQAYFGVIELCLSCAHKLDPNNIALHHYKNYEPIEDTEGSQALAKRMEVYRQITLMLDSLMEINSNNPQFAGVPDKPGPPSEKILILNKETTYLKEHIQDIILLVLNSSDELMHIALYDWLLSKDMLIDVLTVTESSLGIFLEHIFNKKSDSIKVCELFWKYHEIHNRHLAAAKILYGIAIKESVNLNLNQRLSYMSRAVLCLRNPSVGYSVHNGVFMRDIEDKIEVASIQQKVIDSVAALNCSVPDIHNLVQTLNSKIFDITQLYEEFADPLELWEVKLAILKCSDHNDPLLVETVWQNIINQHLNSLANLIKSDRMQQLMLKIQPLLREYMNTAFCLPLGFLIKQLEVLCCRLKADCSIVPSAFIESGVQFENIIEVYKCLISLNERVWGHEGNELHLVQASSKLISFFFDIKHTIPVYRRTKCVTLLQDFVASCLSSTYSNSPHVDQVVLTLRSQQAQLSRG